MSSLWVIYKFVNEDVVAGFLLNMLLLTLLGTGCVLLGAILGLI